MAAELTLAEVHAEELVVKKSRFVAVAAPVASAAGAFAFFDECRDQAASHNCWAYKIGAEFRFNDDGEPGGTAGKPILTAIENSGLENIAVMVVRYYGGIKLGAGGLVRAYNGSASQCLRDAAKQEIVSAAALRIQVPFEFVGTTMTLVDRFEKIDAAFDEKGAAIFARVPESKLEEFREELGNRTRGSAVVELLHTFEDN